METRLDNKEIILSNNSPIINSRSRTFIENKGFLNGLGKIRDKNGRIIYEGKIKSGEPSGYGTKYQYENLGELDRWISAYNENLKKEVLKLETSEFYVLEGEWKYGTLNGFATIKNDKNINVYRGQYKLGKKDGFCKEYWDNGIISYQGEWKNDKKDGKGKIFDRCGRMVHEGLFKNGVRLNEDPIKKEKGRRGKRFKRKKR